MKCSAASGLSDDMARTLIILLMSRVVKQNESESFTLQKDVLTSYTVQNGEYPLLNCLGHVYDWP